MPEKVKVLFVEDDQVDRMAFERFIERENLAYDYKSASSVSEARDTLATEEIDVMLTDYLLGDGVATDLFDVAQDIPVIVITGSGDEKIAVEAMKGGAYDYLIKDPEGNYLTTLPVTVENALRRKRAEQELERYQKHLEELVERRTTEITKVNEQLRLEIVERKRAEEEVRRLSQFRQSVIDNAKVWINVLDSESNIVLWNQAAEEISGYSREEVVDHDEIWKWLYPDETYRRELKAQLADAIVKDDIIENFQTTIQRRDGQTRIISWNAQRLSGKSGAPPRIIAIGHDVTERKQAEEALESERQRLEALVEHLPEGVILLNEAKQILLSNPAAEIYLPLLVSADMQSANGVAHPDQLLHLAGRPIEKLLQPPSRGLWHELEVAGPPRRIFEAIAQPTTTTNDTQVKGWVLLLRDVTREREIQQRVHRQERLAAVGQLAGGIAHDFNNLLTTIMLYAQISMNKENLPPDLIRSLETILNESQQATKLIQQILDFSRRSPLETSPLNLEPLIKETVNVLKRTIPENISLQLKVEPEEYIVSADPTRIQQVLMNLVVNARDAMPEGGTLHISLSKVIVDAEGLSSGTEGELKAEIKPPDMPDGVWICLAVKDTGVGIPPQVLPYIFEPFFTTKPPGEGAGLGLAQVYGIVKQHTGYIGVKTELRKGTTFRIYLPAYQVEEAVPQEKIVPATPKGRGEMILLVEDNEQLRHAGREILETLGYQVLTASNGRKAIKIYRSAEKVDLLITDLVMPKMGGKRLIQKLRTIEPSLKTLVITGYMLKEDLEALRREGIQDIIHKPFDTNVMAKAIHRILASPNENTS